MKKKLVSLLLGAVMCTSTVAGLAACGKGDDGDYDYNITVWVGEKTDAMTRRMIDEFNKTNTLNDGKAVKFKATVRVVSESSAAGDILAKKESAPDVYSFAQDQLARLVSGGMISALGNAAKEKVQADNDEGSVAAVTVGNSVYAFPMTSDNSYFMYYDKSVITDETHLTSLEALISDCEAARNYFACCLAEDGAWYAAAFFHGTGCESSWFTNEAGIFTADYVDTYNTPEGLKALKGMQKLLKSTWHKDKGAAASDFAATTPAAVLISGTWDYNAAKQALGSNFAVAPLPKFSVDGQEYQLKPFAGYKMMGVKPQSDPYKQYYLQQLAQYLTNEENQLKRFNEVGWGPSNTNAQSDEEVQKNEALKVIAEQAEYSIVQGQYPTNWWADVAAMCGGAKDASSDSVLQGLLDTYSSKFSGYVGSSAE